MTGDGAIPPGHIVETVTSLEMFACPEAASRETVLPPGCRIERVIRPSVAFYRFLYDTVGEPWLWGERRRWTDSTLAEWVQDESTEVWLLGVDGQPAGFAELDRRAGDDVELSYFGLLPDFIGRRLGPLLLRTAVHRAWTGTPTGTPRRVWVHTCDLDHPAALDLYRREGFRPFRTHVEVVPDPRATGHIPSHVQPQRPIVA